MVKPFILNTSYIARLLRIVPVFFASFSLNGLKSQESRFEAKVIKNKNQRINVDTPHGKEFQYQYLKFDDITIKSIGISRDGSDPLKNQNRYRDEENQNTSAQYWWAIRIFEKGRLIKEIWNYNLPISSSKFECDQQYGRCGGLDVIAYDPNSRTIVFTQQIGFSRLSVYEVLTFQIKENKFSDFGQVVSSGGEIIDVKWSRDYRYCSFITMSDPVVIHEINFMDLHENRIGKYRPTYTGPESAMLEQCEILKYGWDAENRLIIDEKIKLGVNPQYTQNKYQNDSSMRKSEIANRTTIFNPTLGFRSFN